MQSHAVRLATEAGNGVSVHTGASAADQPVGVVGLASQDNRGACGETSDRAVGGKTEALNKFDAFLVLVIAPVSYIVPIVPHLRGAAGETVLTAGAWHTRRRWLT